MRCFSEMFPSSPSLLGSPGRRPGLLTDPELIIFPRLEREQRLQASVQLAGGMNRSSGSVFRILLRLRPHYDKDNTFLDLEESLVGTMLHGWCLQSHHTRLAD